MPCILYNIGRKRQYPVPRPTGEELELVGQLPISIMQALAQQPLAALPAADVMDAACASHVATRISTDSATQQRIASVAMGAFSACSMETLQLGAATSKAGAASFNPVR